MSQRPAPSPDRQPLEEHAAESVLAYAAAERTKTDALASVLENIAANGYPSPESRMPWETARDAHLAGEQPHVA
ncbi:hypothetical protein ACFVTT_25480 [Streptomyces niveus]|uniref:hypothetical protein n=1 Tax=Streptomyces niveus TaxID=193462 RepID=UPI00341A0648